MKRLKISVGINQVEQYGHSHVDLDVKLEGTEKEVKLLKQHDVPIPGLENKRSRDLLRKCFASHGDFYREVGISNFRTFQPDWQYFESTSSNGWRKFMNKLVAEPDREAVLKRVGQILLNKLSLLTHKTKPAIVSKEIKDAPIGMEIDLIDLSDKTMEVRVGPKIYTVIKVQESEKDKKLIDKVVKDLEIKAEGAVKGYGVEFADNLKLVRTQYEKTIAQLKAQMEVKLPGLNMPYKLLQQGIMVDTKDGKYTFYIPIHLSYKYITTPFHAWELKKKYRLEQDGYLVLAMSPKFALYSSNLLDVNLKDTLQLWHMSGGICMGSYRLEMKKLEDLPKIRDDIAKMLETINTNSMGRKGLKDDQIALNTIIQHCKYKKISSNNKDDMDLSEVANLIGDKTKGGGKIWST